MKFGSVVICHGVEDQVATRKGKIESTHNGNSKFKDLLAETLAEALNSFELSLKFSSGFFVVVGRLVVVFVFNGR
jgi:hypothetical protein